MPALITHYLGGKTALEAICPKIREYIAPMTNLFNLGTQGPDIFFYYISGFITKRISGVGTQMHNQDLGRFFMHMADSIKDARSPSQKRIVFAYTAGFLAHYAMDAATHSYVYAQTYNSLEPKLKESTRHRDYEAVIDVLMLRHMQDMQPGDLDQAKLITPDDVHKKAAAMAMAGAIRDVYGRDIYPWDVYRAMGQMAGFTHCLESKTGKRKSLLGMAETVVVGSKIISALIHKQAALDDHDYLNLSKSPWQAPWDEDNVRNESFLELFDLAVADAAKMIHALYAYIRDELSKEQLAAKIMNRSLKTGEDAGIFYPGEECVALDEDFDNGEVLSGRQVAAPTESCDAHLVGAATCRPQPDETPQQEDEEYPTTTVGAATCRPQPDESQQQENTNLIAAVLEVKEDPPETTDIETWLDTMVTNARKTPPA